MRLGQTVVLWLYLYLIGSLLVVASTALSLWISAGMDANTPVSLTEPTPGLEIGDLLVGLSGILYTLTYLIAGFLTLKWIYRVSKNAHVLASGLTVSAPWAVGWYFVPFANLFMPFRAMREAWQASEGPQAWRSVPVPSLLRWWWALWLIGNMISSLSFRLGLRAGTLGEAVGSQVLDVISGFIDIPLALVLIRIVRRLSATQQAALQRGTFD